MNVAYPLIDSEVRRFALGKEAVLMIEEGQPEFIEQGINTSLRQADLQTRIHGKDMFSRAGEYAPTMMLKGLLKFFERYRPDLVLRERLPSGVRSTLVPKPVPIPVVASRARPQSIAADAVQDQKTTLESVPVQEHTSVLVPVLAPAEMGDHLPVHARPPSFCTGCPERPIFTALKLVERELGKHHISCDIGCHLFSILPPFNLGATTMGYGLGVAGAAAFSSADSSKRAVAIMGDGGFWHNGLTSGIGNSVFNKSDNVTLIVDNGYSAATGGQDILSSKADNARRVTQLPIEQAVRGVGVKWVRTLTRTYDIAGMRDTLRDALTTVSRGPKVIIAQSECMLNKQRRVKPLMRKAIGEGKRVVQERFGVDDDVCTGDHSCIRISGCPSLSIKDNPDPLRTDPVATVLDSCVGCGVCGEAAHAAVLCPSFFRAELISNPRWGERLLQRLRSTVIEFLQRRLAAREVRYV